MMNDLVMINGDCRVEYPKIMDQVDLVLTDPPYNIGYKYDGYDDQLSEDEYIDLLSVFKGSKLAIIQYPENTIYYYGRVFGMPDEVMAWCYFKNIRGPRFRLICCYNVKPQYDRIRQPRQRLNDPRVLKEFRSKGVSMYDWFEDIGLVTGREAHQWKHVCPVPIELMERLIILLTDEGQTICDPFMGSGTTAIACLKLKRKFIGIEQSELYVKEAWKRVEMERMRSKI